MVMELVVELLKLSGIAALAIAAILAILIWKKNRTTKITYIKIVIQVLALVSIFYMYTYTIKPIFILAFILILPIVLGRFFCGWLCPFGLYMDVITIVRKALRIRYINLSSRLNKFLHNFRYVLFAAFPVVALVLAFLETDSSLDVLLIKLQLFAGPFEHLGILLSPLNPLIVPWEGPVEISGLYFSFPYAQDIIKYAGENFAPIMVLSLLGSVLVASVFVRRFWCRICPTGISITVINKLNGFKWAPLLHLQKDETKCTKCGICKRVCPVQVEEVYEQKGGAIGTSMCMLCARCVEMCPYEDCLKLNFGGKTVLKSRNWLEPSELE